MGHASEIKNSSSQNLILFTYGDQEHLALNLNLVQKVESTERYRIKEVGDKEYFMDDSFMAQIIRLDHFLGVDSVQREDEGYILFPKIKDQYYGIVVSDIEDVVEREVTFDYLSEDNGSIVGTAEVDGRLTKFMDLYRLIDQTNPGWSLITSQFKHINRNKTVLVIEDDPFYQCMMRKYLKSGGFQVVLAKDTAQAIRLVSQQSFDLILTDLFVPFMNGYELLQSLESFGQQHTPLVAVCNDSVKDYRDYLFDLGFVGIETKVDRERLLWAVNHLIHKEELRWVC